MTFLYWMSAWTEDSPPSGLIAGEFAGRVVRALHRVGHDEELHWRIRERRRLKKPCEHRGCLRERVDVDHRIVHRLERAGRFK